MAEAAAAEQTNGADAKAPPAASLTAFAVQIGVPSGKVEDALAFYKAAFGAEEVQKVNHPKRKAEQEVPLVSFAKIKIGDAVVAVYDLGDDSSKDKVGANVDSGILFGLQAEDVAAAVAAAVKAGAVQDGELTEEDGLCGSGIVGKVKDSFGHVWAISAKISTTPAVAEA